MSGVIGRRDEQDECLLKCINELGIGILKIYDARPYLNAYANKVLFKIFI